MQEITSIKNTKVKYWFQLYHKSALRKKQKEFVIEGVKEVKMAIENKYEVHTMLVYNDLFDKNFIFEWKNTYNTDFEIILISKEVFEKLAYRKTTGGIMAISKMPKHQLSQLKISKNPVLLIAEQIEKPGNLGAMLRTTDGAGVDAFILVNPKVDLYNPNVIRSSLGTIFSNKIAITNIDEIELFLDNNNIQLYQATLQNSNPYWIEDFTIPTAISVGAEDKGLTKSFRKIKHKAIYIPMMGQADSLNVSVSAAILCYETLKQRSL